MAASKILDPTTCTTASEAFKYPLSQVRQFHRSLTSELDEKNARLRTLVGGSYRQLLGTAEMILHMRNDINVVEDMLGRVGKGCGRGVVNGKVGGLVKLQERGRGGKRGVELDWAARMKVLDMCALVVGRLLKNNLGGEPGSSAWRGKNLVLAAKVLVLSRLLGKSVTDLASKRSNEDRELAEAAKRKLDTSRKRLVRAIERTLERTGDNRDDLIQALSAYSLTKSSGTRDVLRRFLEVRGDAMAVALEDIEDNKSRDQKGPGYERALRLYAQTLLDVQALVPRRLSEALASLKARHLLKDESLRQLEGLRLDVCENWFGDEILFFTPYIRHNDLDGTHAADMLKGWAKSASGLLLQGHVKILEQMIDLDTVVSLRTKVLEIWITEGSKARDFDFSILLDELRKVVNARLVQLLSSRVSKLHLVGTEIEGTLGSWREGVTDRPESLWNKDMLEMEITNGAGLFKQNILSRTYGRNNAVSRALRGYQTWRHFVDEIVTVIEQLKKQRWDDDLEDIEDEPSLESRNILLRTDDPQMLQDRLDNYLSSAYKDLHNKIVTLLDTYADSEDGGQISIYLLRIIREIRSELPANASTQTFGLSLVTALHKNLVFTATQDLLDKFSKSFIRKTVAGRALWEGPDELSELPVQPSPATFKFLHGLALYMEKLGGDLWSPHAVAALKQYLRSEIGRRWIAAFVEKKKPGIEANGAATNGDVSSEEGPLVNGNGNTEEAKANGTFEPEATPSVEVQEAPNKEVLIQSLFDTLVLQSAFEMLESSPEDGLLALGQLLEVRVKLGTGSKKRLQQAAKEYWKRASLLFGLLA